MPRKPVLSAPWEDEDLAWLRELNRRVPLAQGRMEIRSSPLAAVFRLVLCLFLVAGSGIGGVSVAMNWSGWSQLVPLLLCCGLAAIAAARGWDYTCRMVRALRGTAEFVLSSQGLFLHGRLHPWTGIISADYSRRSLRGYISHTCRIRTREGDTVILDLDTTALSADRIMVLMDFYASGARLP